MRHIWQFGLIFRRSSLELSNYVLKQKYEKQSAGITKRKTVYLIIGIKKNDQIYEFTDL